MADLAHRLRQRIRQDGPLPFRDWMEACLYDPEHGYYIRPGRKTGPGPDADFATSPTLHPFLAQAVAREAASVWEALDRPASFQVVEFGGGEGDLARDALAWLDAHAPDLAAAVRWVHVEQSPTHREAQQGDDDRIEAADAMPPGVTGLVVAHEFIDALPVHLLERRKGGWAEVHITVADDGFAEILGVPSRTGIEAAPKRTLEEGQRVAGMADARQWLDDVAQGLQRGAVLVIDYGDLGKHLWVPDRPDGTVRGFRDQRLVEDVLQDPGDLDITASVDFTQLKMWAIDAGFQDGALESQEAFLVRHGALETLAEAPKDSVEDASAYLRLKQMVLPQGMGAAFKVQRLWKGIDAPDAEDEG